MINLLLVVLMILASIDLTSCAVKPIPLTREEVRSRMQEDRAVLTKDQEPVSDVIDLYTDPTRPVSLCHVAPSGGERRLRRAR
jgi:hypothetical protein